jgi:hypothetical protein
VGLVGVATDDRCLCKSAEISGIDNTLLLIDLLFDLLAHELPQFECLFDLTVAVLLLLLRRELLSVRLASFLK